ncbi:GNAT family N-acetyltransferase [Roseomonas sp. CAU 1739]|uniref:GNAT family N-acetyltransferase n=1 Tax=Roseomonas sp. CAU 1739 TaxID=3140364 RepID=UPI00325A4512
MREPEAMQILRVTTILPAGLPALARDAAGEGFGMLDVLLRDWADGRQRFTGAGEALFAARDAEGRLCGIGGVTRDPWVEALRMRRFYVAGWARRSGIGAALARAAIGHARQSGAAHLRLRAPVTAFPFWEALGFVPIPGNPQATHALAIAADQPLSVSISRQAG